MMPTGPPLSQHGTLAQSYGGQSDSPSLRAKRLTPRRLAALHETLLRRGSDQLGGNALTQSPSPARASYGWISAGSKPDRLQRLGDRERGLHRVSIPGFRGIARRDFKE